MLLLAFPLKANYQCVSHDIGNNYVIVLQLQYINIHMTGYDGLVCQLVA